MMNLADEYGFLVINEVPAVGMHWWDDYNFAPDKVNAETAVVHKELIRQLMERDKNHPSIVMFSVANEPATHEEAAGEYFRDVISYTRTVCDLPLTLVEFTHFTENSLVTDLIDVVCINRYYAWYTEHGQIDVVRERLLDELQMYYEAAKKPIIVTEFGADTLEGVHMLPSETFTEEWQEEYLIENFKAIDACEGCIGEHIWNLADFKTKEGLRRARGNRKGVFTRDRQPKMSAHYVRKRWKNK
jgi:beta-glucuronidase